MKKLFYTLLLLMVAGNMQMFAQCNAQYTAALISTQSLNAMFNITSTYGSATNTTKTFSLYFGDGTSVNYDYQFNYFDHSYAAPGVYNTMLVIKSVDSATLAVLCTDTAYQQVSVNYSPCDISISTVNNGGGSYSFTANNLAGTSGLNYTWNFSDGTSAYGNTVTHSFIYGYHTVNLYSSDSATCSGYDAITLIYADTTVNCDSLYADYTYYYSGGLDVMLYNTSTMPYGAFSFGLTSEADWYFGDGTSQLNTNSYNFVNHTYPAYGTYTITMVNRWVDSISGQIRCIDTFASQITLGSPTNKIEGIITYDSLTALSIGAPGALKVWLIQHDSVANTLTAVDSLMFASNPGSYYVYLFNNKPAGNYFVKAAALNQTVGAAGWLPTYHYSSVYWGGATIIPHAGGYSYGKDILLQSGTVTSGPGFIGGNISLGAGKGTGTGIADMLILLRDASNALIASAVTDANGDYAFNNIPIGTYNVYPEEMNYQTTPYNSIQVTSGQASISAIDFVQKNNLIYPKGSTAIAHVNKEDGLKIYPNPAKNELFIENKNDRFTNVQVVNTLGQKVMEYHLKSGTNKLNVSGIQTGTYYLLISGPKDARSMKINLQ